MCNWRGIFTNYKFFAKKSVFACLNFLNLCSLWTSNHLIRFIKDLLSFILKTYILERCENLYRRLYRIARLFKLKSCFVSMSLEIQLIPLEICEDSIKLILEHLIGANLYWIWTFLELNHQILCVCVWIDWSTEEARQYCHSNQYILCHHGETTHAKKGTQRLKTIVYFRHFLHGCCF